VVRERGVLKTAVENGVNFIAIWCLGMGKKTKKTNKLFIKILKKMLNVIQVKSKFHVQVAN
jgi:hypothetical protein